MVMTHEFEHAFLQKMRQKQSIEHEMERIAAMQQKNAKHNIYITKAQALRNQLTKNTLDDNRAREMEEALLTSSHQPKTNMNSLLKSIGSTPLHTISVDQKSEKRLPPLKSNLKLEEQEIQALLKKNLIYDKPQKKSIFEKEKKSLQPALRTIDAIKSTTVLENQRRQANESREDYDDKLWPTGSTVIDKPFSKEHLAQMGKPQTASGPRSGMGVNLKIESGNDRREKNEMLSQYFQNKKALH